MSKLVSLNTKTLFHSFTGIKVGQKSFITSIPALLRDGEVDVGLVVHGVGGVAGRNVAAVGRLVSAEDVQEEREQARPSRRKQYLVLFKVYLFIRPSSRYVQLYRIELMTNILLVWSELFWWEH